MLTFAFAQGFLYGGNHRGGVSGDFHTPSTISQPQSRRVP